MLFSIRDLKKNFRLTAENEEFGEIKTFLIDSIDWALRYAVIRVGSRDVLLSMRAFGKPDARSHMLPLVVDREKVMNSPDFNLNRRISREMERQLYDYYEWPYDWESDEVPETLPGDLTAVPLIEMELDREEQLVPQTGAESGAGHLASTDDIFGYTMRTSNDDQNAGTLDDLIVNDANWRLMYMIVDTNGLFPGGRKVALAPSWVEKIDEAKSRVVVDLQEDSIKDIPEYRSIKDLED